MLAACGDSQDYSSPCEADSDCPSGHMCEAGRCSADPGGQNGPDAGGSGGDQPGGGATDVECRGDLDCGGQLRCDGGECIHPPGACAADYDCDEDEICEDGSCEPYYECRSDEECGDGYCEEGFCEDGYGGPAYRFVLLTDLTSPVAGEFPGADVDAVELIKFDRSYFSTAVEDAAIPVDSNSAADPYQMVGPADANCDPDSGAFTALGGADAGGYAILSFGTAEEDVTIENGDSIVVYELGMTLCGEFDADPVEVSVGIGNTLGSFSEIGTVIGTIGEGVNEVTVSGL